ncbi:hypothetical protein [Cellulomonas marina]|uniref:hypothetical protein n=1 Tax=Cellulomonas marina TaxID=988821 RepID=UPI0011137764|nr:hypothetical protein [Cellulomonas marina]
MYKGRTFPDAAMEWQKDLYRAAKADSRTAGIPVIGPSLGGTYWGGGNPFPANSLAPYVDWGNFHPYPGGNSFSYPSDYAGISRYYWNADFPSVALDRYPTNFDTYRPPFGLRPMAATETGYSTFRFGQSEKMQGRYVPRIFLENFRLGIRRTFLYELVDSFDDPTGYNREAHFGLLRHDLTPKPAFYALQSLISAVSAPKPSALTKPNPPSPQLTLQVNAPAGYDASGLHHLQFARADGSTVLALWHEISGDDLSPLQSTPQQPIREVYHPCLAVTVSGVDLSAARTTAIGDDGRLVPIPSRAATTGLKVQVGEQVTFVTVP